MIAYIHSSVLARAYLPDERGHEEAVALLEDPDLAVVTGAWTLIEVSGTLVRASRCGRCDLETTLRELDAALGADGSVTVVGVAQDRIEAGAFDLVRTYGLRALDAWHLAAAGQLMPKLAEPGEAVGFASRDEKQSKVAALLGFEVV